MDGLKIVSISFHTAGKIFDFDSQDFELSLGDKVIVETERGRALGKVVRDVREITPDEAPPKLKSILRIATESDLQMAQSNALREQEALQFCQQRVKQRKMEMKLVRAEYLFDGSKIIFYFTADGRIDFRELVRDLAQHFRTRIEMRQIGVRDEAKQVGGLGICGRELCCSNHLREFVPVSVKMAKAQGLALNPTKISGQCGRLLCCLAYEYETYNEMKKTLPKCGKKLLLETGPAEVISRDILAQKVTLIRNGERRQLHIDDLNKEIKAAEKKQDETVGTNSNPADKQAAQQPQKPRRKPVKSNHRVAKKHNAEKPPVKPEQKAKQEEPTQEKSKRRRRRPRRRTNRQAKPTDNPS
ncbi:Cell fate regulator YaaT, PSP1 superfamily (controls sporulation, competence, biofilm development) [Desulfuromusa kysingii]|uniref:Cell fate regulator YaaT, PSP1 superfamily (Controls sporulation, competence, biofilm development) n=1 Tax=Desulfuromusa kysingii TaxID=37625 RepID=A0A1H4BI14_9BACT|nr:stage 0 sporulation family protein [Desulfuromusa kysingii]SEA47432.1 Cell fate regulator YaaT, PSP1 superfamily (controls sporulation, competence, biofilm development) [Desulfuromusa kysingii]